MLVDVELVSSSLDRGVYPKSAIFSDYLRVLGRYSCVQSPREYPARFLR